MVTLSPPQRPLPAGVAIHRATPAHRDLLQQYFDRLPYEDRLLRFFSPSPPRTYVDAWLALEEEGGGSFVVTRTQPDGTQTCVGEAGYVPRGDGTAEFALSLAPEARGGLGTLLLEHLREGARVRGVRALYADVLTDNGAMNRLLSRHGRVTVERDSSSVAGVVIATGQGVPPWPEREPRPARVLIEAAGGQWAGEDALREAGYQVAVCPGPKERPAPDPCPVLDGRRCELVDGADVIVHALGPEHPSHQRLADTLAAEDDGHRLLRRPPTGVTSDPEAVAEVLRRSTPRSGGRPEGGGDVR